MTKPWGGPGDGEPLMNTLIPEQRSHVEAGRYVVEHEWPHGSGSWGYTDDLAHALREVERYLANGCHVWLNGMEQL